MEHTLFRYYDIGEDIIVYRINYNNLWIQRFIFFRLAENL